MKISIIDPVGVKAGMNNYDIGLARGFKSVGIDCVIHSNFISEFSEMTNFTTSKLSTIKAIYDFLKGTIFSLIQSKSSDFIITHLFSCNLKELLQYIIFFICNKKIITIVHDVDDFKGKDIKFVKNFIYYFSFKLIVHNKFSRDCLRKSSNKRNHFKINVIRHGNYIDFITNYDKMESRRLLQLPTNRKIILFFGQIKKVKGLDILIQSLANTNDNIYLVVAGKLFDEDINIYLDLVKKLNLTEKVRFDIKFITDKERNFYFSATDIVILPYKKIYQSGVLFLSMSHGLPVIVSNLEANKEVIENKFNGVLFESENIESLSNQIDLLLTNPELCNKISKQAITTMQDDYNWKEIAIDYKKMLCA